MKTERMETSYVAAKLIRRNPWNRQPDEASVKELEKSIREVGVLQPVTARPVPGETGTDLELVMGERRWAAAARISPDYELPVIIRHLDEKETAKLLAVENFQRRDLNPVEEARAIRHMRDTGWTNAEIAESIGRSVRSVQKSLQLLKLPAEGQEAVANGELAIETAILIVGLPEAKWARAIEDCVRPPSGGAPLTLMAAAVMLRERYIEPIEKSADWESKRHAAENEWPTAKWTSYEEARSLSEPASGWYPVLNRPEGWRVSRHFAGEVPTWLELAQRHGAEIRFGLGEKGEPVPMVDVEPLIDAEKAAHAEHPAQCVFEMARWEEAPATAEDRDDREREKVEARAQVAERRREMVEEHRKLGRALLDGNHKITGHIAIAEWGMRRVTEDFEEALTELLGIDPEVETDLTLAQRLAGGDNPTLAMVGTVAAVAELASVAADSPEVRELVAQLLDLKAIRAADFPALAAAVQREAAETPVEG